MKCLVGCTGWGYKEWVGTFYPRNMTQKDWLVHYSSIFPIVEVNSSFYRIIPKTVAHKWYNITPPNFRFSLKFPREITHDNFLNFAKSRPILSEFFSGLEPLKNKIDILVLQLPPSLSFDKAKPNLETLEEHLPHYCRYAIEGRHVSWFYNESLNFLKDHHYSLVWSEIPTIENPAHITTDFIYVRLIGDRNLPHDVYDHRIRDQTQILQKWANLLKTANNKVKLSWILINNHLEGFAPDTANVMRNLLGLCKLKFNDKRQKSLF